MSARPATSPCFEFVDSWQQAAALLAFEPLQPAAGKFGKPRRLAVYLHDHKQRSVALEERSLEAYYDGFVFSQAQKGEREARRLALEVAYGTAPRNADIGGREARVYELGAEPKAGDIDPRSPAVAVWCDAAMFYLLASDSMELERLLPIAERIGAGR